MTQYLRYIWKNIKYSTRNTSYPIKKWLAFFFFLGEILLLSDHFNLDCTWLPQNISQCWEGTRALLFPINKHWKWKSSKIEAPKITTLSTIDMWFLLIDWLNFIFCNWQMKGDFDAPQNASCGYCVQKV